MAVAETFGQLSSLLLAEEAARQQGMQSALSNLSGSLRNYGARRQQQSQFDTSLGDARSRAALDEAYRRAALDTNTAQFGQTRADRLRQVDLDEAYRRDALRQNNELAKLQIKAMEDQQRRVAANDLDRTVNSYFQNAVAAERSGVDTAPEVLAMLKPEQRAQIEQFRLAQNQELGALNTSAAAATDRMNSVLRSQLSAQEKAVQDLQARLPSLPDSTFLGIGMNKAEGAQELERLQTNLNTLRDQAANTLFKQNRGLDQLATFDPAAGRFVPLLRPLRRVGETLPPVATPTNPTSAVRLPSVGMGNVRAMEAMLPEELYLSTDSPPAQGWPLYLSTDSPPAESPPLYLPTDSPPAPSPMSQARPGAAEGLSSMAAPAAPPREVQVGEFFVTEDIAALAVEEYNRVLAATGSPEQARTAARMLLSRRQNIQKAPSAQIMGGFPILSGMR